MVLVDKVIVAQYMGLANLKNMLVVIGNQPQIKQFAQILFGI